MQNRVLLMKSKSERAGWGRESILLGLAWAMVPACGYIPNPNLMDEVAEDTDDSTTDDSTTDDSTTDDSTTDCGPDTLTSGSFLLALETSLGPDSPLQFVLTLDVTITGDCTGIATASFQPLSLDFGSTIDPREFVGDPLVFPDVGFDASGNFGLDLGIVMVTGAANPITGSDMSASLVLAGHVVHADALCGEVTGMLMSPLEYDLAGSTFAAIRLADDGSDPATLPGFGMFPYKCSQVPPP